MGMQSVLHALFLPTPFKRALANLAAAADPSDNSAALAERDNSFTEVLKPGALYRECAVVTLKVPPLPKAPEEANETKSKPKSPKSKKKAGDEVDLVIEEDGEYGGEGVGRLVWEWYETRLKAWEAKNTEDEPVADSA